VVPDSVAATRWRAGVGSAARIASSFGARSAELSRLDRSDARREDTWTRSARGPSVVSRAARAMTARAAAWLHIAHSTGSVV